MHYHLEIKLPLAYKIFSIMPLGLTRKAHRDMPLNFLVSVKDERYSRILLFQNAYNFHSKQQIKLRHKFDKIGD